MENSEMGIIISPNYPRESAPEKTRDVEVKTEFQPRSATIKLMAIICALIIMILKRMRGSTLIMRELRIPRRMWRKPSI